MRAHRPIFRAAALLLLAAIGVGTRPGEVPAPQQWVTGRCRGNRQLLETSARRFQTSVRDPSLWQSSDDAPAGGSLDWTFDRIFRDSNSEFECSQIGLPPSEGRLTLSLKGGAGLDWVEQRLNSIFNSGGANR